MTFKNADADADAYKMRDGTKRLRRLVPIPALDLFRDSSRNLGNIVTTTCRPVVPASGTGQYIQE